LCPRASSRRTIPCNPVRTVYCHSTLSTPRIGRPCSHIRPLRIRRFIAVMQRQLVCRSQRAAPNKLCSHVLSLVCSRDPSDRKKANVPCRLSDIHSSLPLLMLWILRAYHIQPPLSLHNHAPVTEPPDRRPDLHASYEHLLRSIVGVRVGDEDGSRCSGKEGGAEEGQVSCR